MQIQTAGNALAALVKASTNGFINTPSGQLSEMLISELMPVGYGLTKAGVVYSLTAAGINPSAFIGGAAGTPIFGVYNPSTSGKDFVLLQSRIAIRTTGSAAAATDINYWTGIQGTTAPTGAQTQPKNVYTNNLSGSVSFSMVNTANTGAVASTLVDPAFSIGLTAATAITNVATLVDDLKGLIVISPGSYFAMGLSVALTAGSIDASLKWAEVAV